jgi:hypothetical protein
MTSVGFPVIDALGMQMFTASVSAVSLQQPRRHSWRSENGVVGWATNIQTIQRAKRNSAGPGNFGAGAQPEILFAASQSD